MSNAYPSPDPAAPLVSVVAPAYYSTATIPAFLDGLARQTFTDFEIILVNSSPEPDTASLLTNRYPHVRFEQSPRRLLPHAARNHGVELARGSILVFTDPDIVPAPDWLAQLVSAARLGHPLVSGAMGLLGSSAFERTVHICKFSCWLPTSAPGPRSSAPTANALYTRELWNALGPFSGESFSSDSLHSWRAAALGAPPWFVPSAVVFHHHEGSMKSFLRERHIRGRDFARLRVRYQRRSRAWAALHLLAAPAIPFLELARTARRAAAAGWTAPFLQTAPLQLAANTAWALGEARTHLSLLFSNLPAPPVPTGC